MPAALVLCLVVWASAQDREVDDLLFIARADPPSSAPTAVRAATAPVEGAPLSRLGTAMIRLYQRYVATQDLPTCSFEPSCSQFGAEAIRTYGPLRGVLLTADRLMRDNGMQMQRRYATSDERDGRFLDPIERYDPLLRETACHVGLSASP